MGLFLCQPQSSEIVLGFVADSSESVGMKWATPSSGTPSFVGCFLTKTSNQTISDATETIVTFPSEVIDTDGYHNTSTNTGRITIPSGKAGKYLITTKCRWQSLPNSVAYGYIYKNGTDVPNAATTDARDTVLNVQNIYIFNLAVADYLEFRVYQEGGSGQRDLSQTSFGAIYLGA